MKKELSKIYNPSDVEGKWYDKWIEEEVFTPSKDSEKEPFTLMIPPPNVTGILHLGHVLNNSINDVLVRKARMQGKNTLWVPGTDHASIATEAKVTKYLKEKGIDKKSIGRDKFLEHCWEWTDKYGGIIIEQLKRMGCSCDWSREWFTMDEEYYKSVIQTFVKLYNDGLIYHGTRMINWDPVGKTALSNEEVIYKEDKGSLWHIKYPIKDESEYLIVATTRPETMLGDTGVAINPNDKRYKKYLGKSILLPIVNKEIPIFADEYVDMEFGTGCVKVTPAHDMNDYDISKVQINSSNPCLIVFLLDQSGSMDLTYGGNSNIKKKDHLAESINQTIYEIGLRSISGGGDMYPYTYMAGDIEALRWLYSWNSQTSSWVTPDVHCRSLGQRDEPCSAELPRRAHAPLRPTHHPRGPAKRERPHRDRHRGRRRGRPRPRDR